MPMPSAPLPPPLSEAEVKKMLAEDDSLTYNDLKNVRRSRAPLALRH